MILANLGTDVAKVVEDACKCNKIAFYHLIIRSDP